MSPLSGGDFFSPKIFYNYFFRKEGFWLGTKNTEVVRSGEKWFNCSLKWGVKVFIGEYHHTLDGKGRLILPAKFRTHLGDCCIATRGLDHCLFVFPIEEWRSLEQRLRNLPLTKPEARAFSRFFFSGATECELDGQGRILISPSLREYAAINREIVIIGVSARIEIWAKERWLDYCAKAEETYEELAEKMGEGGIISA